MAFIGNTPDQQAFTPAVDFFNGDGSTVAFTLSKPVASVAQVQAVISNVPQNPGSAYTVSGNTITFTSAPPSGTQNIYVYYTSPITQVIAPGQNTVTTTALMDGAVTPAKLSTGGPSWDTNGNLGAGGAAIAAWATTKAMQIGARASLFSYAGTTTDTAGNLYYDGTNYKYLEASYATLYRQATSTGRHQWYIAPSGNAGDNVSLTQVLAVEKDKSLALQGASSVTGTGITFPASQSASTDANTLDDYEEGTWTPTLTASSSGSPTINSYSASYVKVGRLVQVVLDMSVTKSTAAGYMTITGLPFAVENGYYPQSAMMTDKCASQFNNPIVQFSSNTTSCYPIINSGSTTSHDQAQWSQWGAGAFTFRLAATYRTSS